MDSSARVLQEFFARSFNGYWLREDERIFELGFVNSLFALQLVEFVESYFEIALESEDLEMENFASINGMLRLVERKQRSLKSA